MTRGNQREVDRQRAAARRAKQPKESSKEGNSAVKRQQRDAEIMREKQKQAMEKKSEETNPKTQKA